jgi:hypothetical protein
MGLFSFLKEAASEANEEAHGARLLGATQASFIEMESLEPKLQFVAMACYLQIRERLQSEVGHMSSDEKLKLGRIMANQALEERKFDMAAGYAKFMAGMWLESAERNSLKSNIAHRLLDDFANYARQAVNEMQ